MTVGVLTSIKVYYFTEYGLQHNINKRIYLSNVNISLFEAMRFVQLKNAMFGTLLAVTQRNNNYYTILGHVNSIIIFSLKQLYFEVY